MKNIIALIVLFAATSLLSTNTDQKDKKNLPLLNLKSNSRASEKLLLHDLFKLIQNPNKEKLQEYLQRLDTLHLKGRVLTAIDHDTKLMPLYYALVQDFSNYSTVELLLSHGSDPNKQTNDEAYSCHAEPLVLPKGSTAAHIAIITKKPTEILLLLQQHGCNFSDTFKDAHGSTPLSMAQKHKNQMGIDFINAIKKVRRISSSSNVHQRRTGENSPRLGELHHFDVHFVEFPSSIEGQSKTPPPPMTKDADEDVPNCCCTYIGWLCNKVLCCFHCCDPDD